MKELDTIQKRIEKSESKARIAKDKDAVYEMGLLKPLKEVLEQGLPARKAKLTEDQIAYCKVNYHLLTDKPIISDDTGLEIVSMV